MDNPATSFELRISADGRVLTVRIRIDTVCDKDAIDTLVTYVEQAFDDAADSQPFRPIHAIEAVGNSQILSIRRHYRDRNFPSRFESALSSRARNAERLH